MKIKGCRDDYVKKVGSRIEVRAASQVSKSGGIQRESCRFGEVKEWDFWGISVCNSILESGRSGRRLGNSKIN